MAKRVSLRDEWLKTDQVVDVYSVSNCISKHFINNYDYSKINGWWFYDSPEIIRQVAQENAIDLSGTTLFYYEAYELEFDEDRHQWNSFESNSSIPTKVVIPQKKTLAGYDVVTFFDRVDAECSPLSCNGLATEVETNQHCLLSTLEQAQLLIESGKFNNSEQGPFRIIAVYLVGWH